MKYDTLNDAYTALINSGCLEWFGDIPTDVNSHVVNWMYRNDATPEQAAEYFEVA
jgi:hypothetical protein